MDILDLHLRVEGYPTLDQNVKGTLMSRIPFVPLANTLKAKLASQVQAGAHWLTAEVQGSAVFIAEDWVTSIHGYNLLHCVSTMCLVVNAIREQLNTPVSILLLNPLSSNNATLSKLLEDENRKIRKKAAFRWVAAVLVSGFIGAIICELVRLFVS